MRREGPGVGGGGGRLDDIFRYAAAHTLAVSGGPEIHEKRNKTEKCWREPGVN